MRLYWPFLLMLLLPVSLLFAFKIFDQAPTDSADNLQLLVDAVEEKPQPVVLPEAANDLIIPKINRDKPAVIKKVAKPRSPQRVVASNFDPVQATDDGTEFDQGIQFYALDDSELPVIIQQNLTRILEGEVIVEKQQIDARWFYRTHFLKDGQIVSLPYRIAPVVDEKYIVNVNKKRARNFIEGQRINYFSLSEAQRYSVDNTQADNIFTEYSVELDKWYWRISERQVDYDPLADYQPEFNFPAGVLRNCIMRRLGLAPDEIPTREQMLSLIGLSCKGVDDFSGLESWTHLQLLQLHRLKTADLSVLANFEKLTVLEISSKYVQLDAKQIPFFKQIESLQLSLIELPQPEALSSLTRLKTLILANMQINDISFIQRLNNLVNLDISNNQIQSVQSLTELTGLKRLNIESTGVSDINFIKQLPELIEINASRNKIVSIPYHTANNLKRLMLARNNISFTDNLNLYRGLTYLNLGHNQITQLDNILQLPNLLNLTLTNNDITSVAGLEQLNSIEIIKVDFNPVDNCELLLQLPSLLQRPLCG